MYYLSIEWRVDTFAPLPSSAFFHFHSMEPRLKIFTARQEPMNNLNQEVFDGRIPYFTVIPGV